MPEESKRGQGRQKLDVPKVSKGKNYLFVIGIDKYDHYPKLHNAVKDAETFIDILTEMYQFKAEHVTRLFNEQATRKNILAQLRAYIRKIQPEDNLLIYYSGHGINDHHLDEGYWMPVDVEVDDFDDCVPHGRIIKLLKAIRSRHTLLIIDSCFSGEFLRERGSETVEAPDENIPSRYAITSGRDEPVSDGRPGDHSPFAHNLLFFLRENQERKLAARILFEKLKNATANNAKQIPHFGKIFGTNDKGGQFFFHRKGNDEQDWQAAKTENTLDAYRLYQSLHPQGKYVEQAEIIIQHFDEEKAWQTAKRQNTIPAFYQYRSDYPDGKYTKEALQAIEQLEEAHTWQMAQWQNSVVAYENYKHKFPKGKHVEEAQQKIEELLAYYSSALPSEPPKPQLLPTNPGKPPGIEDLVFVAGGSFLMGCTSEQQDCQDQEKPVHKVTIPGFYLSKYPVTKEQFIVFLNEIESAVKITGNDVLYQDKAIFSLDSTSRIFYRNSRFQVTAQYEKHPVNFVSWYGAIAYCKWLSNKTGLSFRLPSEAEWEYAARGGNRSKGYQYAGSNNLDEVGWYKENSKNDTHPVGQKKANELGLFDMSGNVWEWCADHWHDNYDGAPEDGSVWLGGNDSRRVLRGGSCFINSADFRVAFRNWFNPGFWFNSFGFRVAQD